MVKRKRKKGKKKGGQRVSGHVRDLADGTPVRVSGYKRKKRIRKKKFRLVRDKPRKFEVITFRRADTGEIVSKRIYKPL